MAEHTILVNVIGSGPHLNFKEGANVADGEHFLSDVQNGDTVVWRKTENSGIWSFEGVSLYNTADNVNLLADVVATRDTITARVVDPQAGTKHGDLVEQFFVHYKATEGGPVIKEDPKLRIRG